MNNTNKKIIILNMVFLFLILFLGYLVATTRFIPPEEEFDADGGMTLTPTPAPSDLNQSETEYKAPAPPKPAVVADADKYPRFGKSPIFDTIIPRPTPPPTPTKTPEQPPKIEDITNQWRLTSIFENTASFRHAQSNKEWDMTVGQTYSETYRGKEWQIKLDRVDEDNLQAIISFQNQTRAIGMF
ncbi:MAG TPA: hypothetical protein PKW18_11035 [Candidatus Sumerlaeota bacterium]|nr:hypothetical protein [Candidatus Sumerlaeota bacterium]HON49814.1 hypothetical protein [Candidatus Sumerlaeota bacterium]HOR63938.1 hypothetical protein [Candidatus Sumerlaeota bacterium]HPL75086.1 hypothetical protein [Candidatus Sumerlaeota bacterium]HRU53701.1 hypothetical protein [Candidatus Sumerlaeia bacterium]